MLERRKLCEQALPHWPCFPWIAQPKLSRVKLIGLLRLVRLSNSLPAAGLVVLGARLTPATPQTAMVGWAALAMWCITAFGYLSNDLFDRQEDQINKPNRPLVTGVVTPLEAISLGVSLLGAALWISASLGWLAFGAALLVLILLTLYNLRLKATAGWGNLLIGLLAGAALLSGAIAVHGLAFAVIEPLLWPATTLALFITAREVVKTLEDIPGDRLAGKQTVAVAWGTPMTLWLLGGLSSATLLLSWLPWLLYNYSTRYLWLINLGVTVPLGLTVLLLYQAQRQGKLSAAVINRLLWLLKGSYGVGLLALWWG